MGVAVMSKQNPKAKVHSTLAFGFSVYVTDLL